MSQQPVAIRWENEELILLDQTQLPLTTVFEKQESVEQVWDSIKKLKVRGAPAIGVAGAYGLVISIQNQQKEPVETVLSLLTKNADYLNGSRPTAVNLSWALNRMLDKAKSQEWATTQELYSALVKEAELIHEEDRYLCQKIGEFGKTLIQNDMGVLTHCNAGALATGGIGTALATMYLAHEAGVKFRVYADETRPLLQGSRLTAWELQQAGIDVTLICDNMAAQMMSQGLIDVVVVGTDRVVANGDVANKIGTLGVAILAKHFNIPFYVACPSSTIDLSIPTGTDIPIEERGADEVTSFGQRRTAPPDIAVRAPAFDVTPHHLVKGLITEKGIVEAPYEENLKKLFT